MGFILCAIFGHTMPATGWWGDGLYGQIKGGYVDNVGRSHFEIRHVCPRCNEKWTAARFHGTDPALAPPSVQPLYLSAPAADDGWRDKAEGLESDLRSAVQVAWRRGAKEWARLNYPQYIDWLEACGDAWEPAAPTHEVGTS